MFEIFQRQTWRSLKSNLNSDSFLKLVLMKLKENPSKCLFRVPRRQLCG